MFVGQQGFLLVTSKTLKEPLQKLITFFFLMFNVKYFYFFFYNNFKKFKVIILCVIYGFDLKGGLNEREKKNVIKELFNGPLRKISRVIYRS